MNKFTNILVVGAGSWGTALAKILAKNIEIVSLYGRNQDVVHDIATYHKNSAYLPQIVLPKNIKATTILEEGLQDAELVVIATPVASLDSVFKSIAVHKPNLANFLICSKGIACESLKLPSFICRDFFINASIAAMSGPNFAKEIAAEKFAKTLIAAENIKFAQQLQEIFTTAYFHPEISQDILAVEVCGAYKNVLAIAMGLIRGLELGENFLAAFFLKSLAEMKILVNKFGGDAEIVNSLAGMGDLLLTSYSMTSRNTKFGYNIARHTKRDKQEVVEGYFTAKSLHDLANKLQLELPICHYVYRVLYRQGDLLAIKSLLK